MRRSRLALLFLYALPLAAAEMPEVLVTAKPVVPGTVVLAGDDLRQAPGETLADVLVWSGEAILARRGPALADLTLRASTFEQSGIFLDGFPFRDPQTGHFNLDLPLPPSLVESVEFSPVPWGGRGLAGTVEFKTRPLRERHAELDAGSGSFGSRRAGAAAVLPPLAAWGSASQSDGHRPGTGTWDRRAGGCLELPSLSGSRLMGAWNERRFGANDFYGRFPQYDEWEETQSGFATWRGRFEAAGASCEPGLFYRRHRDRFFLDRLGRSSYRNRHVTQVFGTQTRITAGPLRADLHGRAETLDSSNLGKRDRGNGGASLVFAHEGVTLGWEADWLSGGRLQISPLLSASTWILPDLSLTGAISRSYREPSFTELYYRDPQNIGNPDLDCETAWNYTLLPEWRVGKWAFGGTGTLRLERNLIDWARPDPTQPWRTLNVGKALVRGGGTRIEWSVKGAALRIGYDLLDRDADLGGLQSKYALNFPRHRAECRGRVRRGPLALAVRGARFWRTDRQAYNLLDGRLGLTAGFVTGWVGGANLLDAEYQEIAGVPMPGRSFEAGVTLSF